MPSAINAVILNVLVDKDVQHPTNPARIINRYNINPINPDKNAKFTKKTFITMLFYNSTNIIIIHI